MSTPPLPTELIFLVVDQLHDDIDSLKACSLTSKAFVAAARPHLFGKLTVRGEDRSFDDFYKFLLEAPNVRRHIQDLTLSGWPRFVNFLRGVYPTQMLSASLLTNIVSLLPHLRSLELSLLILERAPETPYTSVLHPSLTTLTFSACTAVAMIDYLHLMRVFQPCIRHLRVNGFLTDELVVPWQNPTRVVERLAAYPCFPHDLAPESVLAGTGQRTELFFELLKRTRAVQTLTELEMGFERPEQAEGLGGFLKVAGPNIRTLKLGWSEAFAALSGRADTMHELLRPFNVRACTNLETLVMDFPFDVSIRGIYSRRVKETFLVAVGLIDTISADTLRRIVIRPHVQLSPEDDVKALTHTLDSLDVLPSLEEAVLKKKAVRELCVAFQNHMSENVFSENPPETEPVRDGVEEFVAEKMSKLRERGVLVMAE